MFAWFSFNIWLAFVLFVAVFLLGCLLCGVLKAKETTQAEDDRGVSPASSVVEILEPSSQPDLPSYHHTIGDRDGLPAEREPYQPVYSTTQLILGAGLPVDSEPKLPSYHEALNM